jgi:hypothetical protein
MRDLSTMRQIAESGQPVTLDPETFLKLLDAAETITVPAQTEKRKRGPRDPRPHTREDEDCANWLFAELQRRKPDAAAPSIASWADHVRLMRERDGRTHKQIAGLFRWAQGHSFWRLNIRSPDKLRKQWDRLADERLAEGAPKPGAASGQKFNFADADRSSDEATQAAFMQRHSIEIPGEDVPL